jgi:cyclophilin family peptidyl-prolyl cis-trans isomerase
VPSDKRARQRANRTARVAQLQRAQQRKRNTRRGLVVGVIVLVALVLALWTGGVFNSSSKKPTTTKNAPVTTTTAPGATTTTAPGATTTTVASAPTTTIAPLAATALDANLIARTPPATSADCNIAQPPVNTKATTPASGNAVAIIPAPAKVPFPNLDGSSPHYTKFSSAPPFCIDVNKTYTATITTDVGVITVELLPKYAPLTVNNFVFLAGYHYYDGIVYQRVIQGFMDQAGDPTGTGSGGPGYKFKDELPKSAGAYDNGAMAMANSGANTNGSQFFMVVNSGGAELSPSYTMFGQITGGLSVAAEINAAGAAASNETGTPTTYHKIISVTIAAS